MVDSGNPGPSPWVSRFLPLIAPGGTLLDVACGMGRHSRLALACGLNVVALDRYNAGIVDLLGRTDFEFLDTDLEDGRAWPLASRKFDGIVVTNYLFRPLFSVLADAMAPGGVLIYETFAAGNERFGRPSNPDFLLRQGELLAAFSHRLSVVAYEHGEIADPRAAVVQRVCAVAGEAPARLGAVSPPAA